MATNLLFEASLWQDQHGDRPPPSWDGVGYVFFDEFNGGILPFITATADGGEIISFALDILIAPRPGFGDELAEVLVNGSAIWTQDISAVGSFNFASTALSPGDIVIIKMFSGFGDVYGIDAVLTPTAPANPKPGFVLATGDDVSPASGLGTLVTLLDPIGAGSLAQAASYVRTPQGMAAVFYGLSPVFTMQLPEDVGEVAYLNTPKQKFTWRSKKFVFPGQTTFGAAKVVHSCQGGGVKFRLFVDCCCVYQTVVRGCVPFRLPAQLRGITAEIELSGCSRVTEVRLASSIRELMGDE